MSHMKDLCETTQKELQELLEKQTTQNEQIAQLTEKLKVFYWESGKKMVDVDILLVLPIVVCFLKFHIRDDLMKCLRVMLWDPSHNCFIYLLLLFFHLQAAEDQLKDVEENFEQEKKELENKLLEKNNDENKLLARIESLTAESDFTKEQLSAMKAKYENIKNGEISGLIKPVKDSSGKFDHGQFYQVSRV